MLLIVTGSLKTFGSFSDPRPPTFLLAVGIVELGLACWLLSGKYQLLCHRLLVSIFLAFLAYSSVLVFKGVPRCGCFGTLATTSPTLAAGIDVFVIAGLLFWHPSPGESGKVTGFITGPIAVAGCVTAIAMTTLQASGYFNAFSYSNLLEVSPSSFDVPIDLVNGYEETAIVRIRNNSPKPVKIIGWNTSCGNFTIVSGLPLDLLAGDSSELVVSLKKKPIPEREVQKYLVGEFKVAEDARAFKRSSEIRLLGSTGLPVSFIHFRQYIDQQVIDRCFSLEQDSTPDVSGVHSQEKVK